MKFTDDSPHIIEQGVRPARDNLGPIGISNHSSFGFNIRHFYLDWKDGEYKASRKGVSIVPADVPNLLAELEAFINEHDVIPGMSVTITIDEAS